MKQMNALKEVAQVFFKLGCTAFGGPAIHIAMMQTELVEKRKWLSAERFVNLMGITHLIPGPNSTEMTMHLGKERAGYAGLYVAGICFLLPALVLTTAIAYAFFELGSQPSWKPIMSGIVPMVIPILASAVLKLGKKTMQNKQDWMLAIAVTIACLWGFSEIKAILFCGLFGLSNFFWQRKSSLRITVAPLLLSLYNSTQSSIPLETVFWKFLKVGSILYGSGYVLFAYLDQELVSTGILSRLELMEAIAMGQFTPGPVLSTAAFVGYQLQGFQGALVASLGIFFPSFIFVSIINPLLNLLEKSKAFSAFIRSVNVGSVAILAAVFIQMIWELKNTPTFLLIAALGFVLVFYFKKSNPILLVLLGMILSYSFHLIQL